MLSKTSKGQELTASLIDKIARLISREEGERLTAYQDTGGAWTIGKGHLIVPADGLYPYTEKRTITQAESDALFVRDTAKARNAVATAVKIPLNDNQKAALVSLVFNIGTGAFAQSTLLKILNTGNIQGAADQFRKWVYDNGVMVPELVSRRERERELFLS